MITLCELTSAQIVSKSRSSGSFSRYASRNGINRVNVSRVGLLDIKEGSDDLSIFFYVNSATRPSEKYRVDIRIVDFIDHLREYAHKLDTDITIKRLIQNIRPFFNEELKKAEIKINCACPDFLFRFKDAARNQKFYFGIDDSDEARGPNSNKINPHYEGSACKHILRILTRPSLWYEKVLRTLSNVLKNYNSVLVKTLDIPFD